jgi:hypothetical protein
MDWIRSRRNAVVLPSQRRHLFRLRRVVSFDVGKCARCRCRCRRRTRESWRRRKSSADENDRRREQPRRTMRRQSSPSCPSDRAGRSGWSIKDACAGPSTRTQCYWLRWSPKHGGESPLLAERGHHLDVDRNPAPLQQIRGATTSK